MNSAKGEMTEEKIARAYARVCATSSPEAVQALSDEEIGALCEDLRTVMIDRTQKNGGHLASNLGVVELTVAIHRVFSAPTDHIIFDVGHQCYAHKLLTGRAERFDTLRRPGGVSGFPRREESEYDAFGTGHASTSLSAALGFAEADRLHGRKAHTVVVLGDGALTGGMIHEALNNCKKDLRLIIILNENEMSISKNVGHFATMLTRLRTAPGYSKTKASLDKLFEHLPLIGAPMRKVSAALKNALKSALYSNNYFESMGLNYFGPVDGNDEAQVEQLLKTAKDKATCSVIHVKTLKGKGLACAERNPAVYHGISPQTSSKDSPTFSQVFGSTLTELAGQDGRICAITAAMPQGTGLMEFSAAYPNRFFDVGIAEEHAVTFAAGLAANGMRPVVAVYSTFLQRAYDQIIHDVALQHLPVVFAIDRAGLNAADGPTHHGIFDISFLSHIPGVALWEPPTVQALRSLLPRLLQDGSGQVAAVRYPSGRDDAAVVHYMQGAREIKADIFADFDELSPPATVVLTHGCLGAQALQAAQKAEGAVGVIMLQRLNDFDGTAEVLRSLCTRGVKRIVICEEGIRNGGIGMNLSSRLTQSLPPDSCPVLRLLAIDQFVQTVDGQTVKQTAGIDAEDILDAIDR